MCSWCGCPLHARILARVPARGLAGLADAPTIAANPQAGARGVNDPKTVDIAARVLAGEVPAGARLIRWLEDDDPRGAAVLAQLYPHTGRARVVAAPLLPLSLATGAKCMGHEARAAAPGLVVDSQHKVRPVSQ